MQELYVNSNSTLKPQNAQRSNAQADLTSLSPTQIQHASWMRFLISDQGFGGITTIGMGLGFRV